MSNDEALNSPIVITFNNRHAVCKFNQIYGTTAILSDIKLSVHYRFTVEKVDGVWTEITYRQYYENVRKIAKAFLKVSVLFSVQLCG